MVPERRGGLVVGIAVEDGLAGGEPLLGQAVADGVGARAVEMRDGADGGCGRHGAVNGAIDGEEMTLGEFVAPLDFDGAAAHGFEGGTGALAFVSPEGCGGELGVERLAELDHAHGVAEGFPAGRMRVDARGDGKRVNEGVDGGGGAIAGRVERGKRQGRNGGGAEAEEIAPGGRGHHCYSG